MLSRLCSILCSGSALAGLCKALPGTPESLVGTRPVVDSLPGGTLPVVGILAGIPAEGMHVLAEGIHTPAGGTHTPGCHTLASHDDDGQTWTANSGSGPKRDKCSCGSHDCLILVVQCEI